LVSAVEEDKVHEESPVASLTLHAPYPLFVPVSVALKIGVTPEIGLLYKSFKLIEINETAIPSATTGVVPAIVVVVLSAEPGTNITEPSAFVTGPVIVKSLFSALVDLRVQVEIPEALVTEQAVITLVVPVSVAENVGV
jgi:hypothetical protein